MENTHMKKGDRVTTFNHESYSNDENGIPRRDPQITGTVIGWSYMEKCDESVNKFSEHTVVVDCYEDIRCKITEPRIQVKMDKPEMWPFSYLDKDYRKGLEVLNHPSFYPRELKEEANA